jgi:CDGSH-type Zn-finger protein
MSELIVAKNQPLSILVAQGNTYFWRSCGRSGAQPCCDGSQRGARSSPVKYNATVSTRAKFCGCNRPKRRPYMTAPISRWIDFSRVFKRDMQCRPKHA